MTFKYLASPYTNDNPRIVQDRFREALRATAHFLRNKVWVYSPIVHCHELACTYSMPKDAKHWEDYNYAMLYSAESLYILGIDGWTISKGVKGEVAKALAFDKPVFLVNDPGTYNEIIQIDGPTFDEQTKDSR